MVGDALKVRKTIRIEEEVAYKIDSISKEFNLNMSEAVELAVRSYVKKEDSDGSLTSDILHSLTSQLTQKDEQIAQLNKRLAEALENIQAANETASQAQKLHAIEKQQVLMLESTDQKADRKGILESLKSMFNFRN